MAIKIKGLDAVQEVDKRTEYDHMRINRAADKRWSRQERNRQIEMRQKVKAK